jgi:hypothetical protein
MYFHSADCKTAVAVEANNHQMLMPSKILSRHPARSPLRIDRPGTKRKAAAT